MALSPGTGELILRAAQGISQTLQFQQQLAQRQAAVEREQALQVENLKTENKRDKLKLEIDQLQLQKAQLENTPEAQSLRTRAAEADIALTEARTAEITMRRGPEAEKDFVFLAESAYRRGLTKEFTSQLPSKESEWGFGQQNIENEFGHRTSFNATEVFNAEGGPAIFTREGLHRQLTRIQDDRAAYVKEFGNLFNQTNPSPAARSAVAGLQSFDKRLAAIRSGLKAFSDIDNRLSPSQLRASGAEGNPLMAEANAFEEKRAAIGTTYFKAVGMTDPQGTVLARDLRGLAASDNKRPHADALIAHIRANLGRTRAKAIDAPGYPAFVRYMRTFFESDAAADAARRELLSTLP